MNKFYLQVWKSDDGEEELQHFLNDKFGTYVFGFNRQLLGMKTYRRVVAIIKEELETIYQERSTKLQAME